MTLRGWMRVHIAPDLTLLGWPGKRFWHAHIRYQLCYGTADWRHRKAAAEARHQQWVKDGYTLELKRNWRGSLFVNAIEPVKRP